MPGDLTLMPLRKLAATISDALPADIAQDVKKNVRAIVQATLDKMDLVTREEMEIQEKVLARTRERLEVLEARLTELEQEQEQGPG
ncbi:MAG: accessory factor UbiK family protein [Arenicellales bacterium]|nr:accessory factor UbiK family protein [Arenicellales bacterium]